MPALVLAAIALAMPVRAASESAFERIAAANATLLDHVSDAKRFLGDDVTNDILVRMSEDLEARSLKRPSDYPAPLWDEAIANILGLDADLVSQVVAGKPRPMAAIRGLGETFIHARTDGTFQPLAVYVPSGYAPAKPAALAVVLHGRPQTEAELLGPPTLRAIADATNTILIAPWGRGNYDFAEPAGSEVYDAVEAAQAAFNVDAHRIYLTGYSMGGFSVFAVGPLHPERWAGVMCISGAMVNSRAARALDAFRHLNVFVVNGAKDDAVPARFGAQTAAYLAQNGVAAGLYQDAAGTHALRTLAKPLAQAWRDMLDGKVRAPAPATFGPSPSSAPMPSTGRGMPS